MEVLARAGAGGMGRPGLTATGLPEALDWATGAGVRVGVVDSGAAIEGRHPRIRPGWAFVGEGAGGRSPSSRDDRDRIGHGTACIEILQRLAPEVEIYPLRVFDRTLETSPETLAAALRWAVKLRLDVLNLSLGTLHMGALVPLYRACQEVQRAGTILVAATAQGQESSLPAVFDSVIGVGAAHFANPWEFRFRAGEGVECLAQGAWSLGLSGRGQRHVFGTSFAAPQITAIVSLLRQRYPGAGLEEIRRHLARFGVAEPTSASPVAWP
jgi:subtilisin family serine protease